MRDPFLIKIFEHNNWANLQIVAACRALSDEQLDAEPQSATRGTIRRTLTHLVNSQRHYLALLTLPVEARTAADTPFEELEASLRTSGEGLLSLLSGEQDWPWPEQLETKDEYLVKPWVVLVQVINHAGEHREQICSMLTALGVTPPDLDGWSFGEATRALLPRES